MAQVLTVEYRKPLSDGSGNIINSRAFDIEEQSGDIAIMPNWLSDPLYLFNPDNGYVISGDPTYKLINVINYAEQIGKATWGSAIMGETYFDSKNPFNDGISDIIPTFYDISGDGTYQNGIGDHENLKLIDIIPTDKEEPILPINLINVNSEDLSLAKTFGITEDSNDFYVPVMEPGYFYHDDLEYYLYANKITEIFLSGTRAEGNLTHYDLSGAPAQISPIYTDVVGSNNLVLSGTEIIGVSINTECGTEILSGHASFKANEHVPVYDKWGTNYHPFCPFIELPKLPLLCVDGVNKITGKDKTEDTYLSGDTPLYEVSGNTIISPDTYDGPIVITYEDTNTDHHINMGLNLSPFTDNNKFKTLSILESDNIPHNVEIITATHEVYAGEDTVMISDLSGIDRPMESISITVKVNNKHGLPISNQDMTVQIERPIYDISGMLIQSSPLLIDNKLAGEAQGINRDTILFDRYDVTGHPEGICTNSDGMQAGYITQDKTSEFIEIPTVASIFLSGQLANQCQLETDDHGTAVIDLTPNRIHLSKEATIGIYINDTISGYADFTIHPHENAINGYSYNSSSNTKLIMKQMKKDTSNVGIIELEGEPVGGCRNVGLYDVDLSISGILSGMAPPWWITEEYPDPYVSGTSPFMFHKTLYTDDKFYVVDEGIQAGNFIMIYETMSGGTTFDLGDCYADN